MDLHRLRVVGFDTSAREKEHKKKNNVQLEECKKEDRKASSIGNGDQIGDENQSLYDKTRTPELQKKCGEEISHQGISKNYLGDTSDPPGTSIKIDVNDEVILPRTSKQYPGDKLCPGTSKNYLNDTTSTSHLGTSKSQRSKSEIFKIPPRKKPRKRALKINSSDIGLTKLYQNSAYSHQKKRTINLPNRNRNAKKRHKEENIKEKKEKIEDVHFLLARETPSFIRYRRKRTENERTKRTRGSKLTNDIYGFQKSNRSMDQYQTSFLNFIDTDKLPFKKMRVGFHRKRKPPSPVTNCYCKHHAMRVLSSASGNVGSRPIYYNLGTHSHPRRFHQKRDCYQQGFKRERSYCMAKDKTVEVSPSLFSRVCKSLRDAGTGPSNVELYAGSYHRPPRVLEKSTTIQNFTVANEYNQKPCSLSSTPSPCAAYTALSQRSPCELKKSQTFQDVTRTSEGDQKPSPETSAPTPCALCAARTAPPKKKCKKKRKKTKKTFFVFTFCNEYLSRLVKLVTDFHLENKISGKNCIKYVFFGLLIVVWSPCLLAVILAWVVMFPWKLTNILKTDVSKRSFPMNHSFKNRLRKNNLRRDYQRMCFENYLPEKKRSIMTLAASFFSRTVGVVVKSFNAAVSLLKFKKNVPMGAGSSFLPSSHPNPRKRYKLFYADNRGWVMKPLRRKTRPCASNRVSRSMRCEFRPKFWQKSRGQNLKMTSLKKVPCPVHETCNNLRHQCIPCSPAGDACPVQSKGLWPSCVCWDEYLQPPTTLKSLNSHCHRRLQVNIPSTFCYPRSGIAFISTDEKVINPNNLNSNEIENNVSHKNLAKDYRGLRNNGTLPFEVVFNYPCGAKSPLTMNCDTCRAHKLGLSGKTFNMSTKCTSSVLLKGLQGQFPQCWTKHNVGNALLKVPGVHRITSSRHNRNSIPSCKLNRLQLRGQTAKVLNCPFAGNEKLPITNKNSRILQKNINFCNKSILTNTLSQSTLTEQANTSSYKLSYAHKTQNTSKHIPCQKVRNKSKTVKTKPASKCAYDARRLPAKQEFKYKTKNHVTTEKKPSTAKIKSSIKHNIILNYSLENRRKQSKQRYKYKPDLIPVETQTLLNTADITIMTNRDKTWNCSYGEQYEEFKNCYENKPHQMYFATQKQLCTADITTSTNRNVALNAPCKENLGLSKHGYRRKSNQIPVATQRQSTIADITTSTNRNVALNSLCKEKHRLFKHDYKRKPNKIPVATKMHSRTADITTSTNRNVALNCPCEDKHKLPENGYMHKPPHTLVATQMQSTKADFTISTNRNVTSNCPCKENRGLSNHDYKCKPNKIPVATQIQSRTADITTSTHRDVALNCPCEDKHKLPKYGYTHKSLHTLVATQMQSTKADITISTNRNVASNCPCKENRGLSKHDYKRKLNKIPVTTQMQSRTADITTSTNRNVALNFSCEEKHSLPQYGYTYKPHHTLVATQMQSRTADITTSTNCNVALNCPCEEKHEHPKYDYTHKPHHTLVATQMQSRTAETATDSNRDLALNCSYEEKVRLSQHGYKQKPHNITVATQMQSKTADNTTDTNRNVALDYPSGVKSSIANKELLCIASTADKESKCFQDINLSKSIYKYISGQIPVATQKQSNTVDITTMTNRDTALNYSYKHEQSEHTYKYKPDHIPAATQKQLSTDDIITSTKYLSGITPSIPDKDILHACIPSTTGTDTASTQKNSGPAYVSKSQDISIQKQSYKIDASVNCVSDYEKSKIKEIFHPELILSPNKTVDYTDATTSWEKTAPQTQTASFEKMVDGVWGDKRSKKIKGLFKGTKSVALSALKGEMDPECPKRALPKKIIDCGCRTTLKPTATAAEFLIERQADENIFAQYPTEVPPSLNNSFVGGTLEVRRISTTQPLSTRQLQMEEFTKQFQRHANSPLFGIASDCRYGLAPQVTQVSNLQADSQQLKMALACRCCETPQQNERDKDLKQKENNSKNTYTHKICSAKEPPNKQSNITETRTLQDKSRSYRIASDCTCRTNQPTATEKCLYKKVSSSKSTTAKEMKSKSPQHLPLSKSLPRKCRCKSLPRKCRCKSLSRKFRCPVESVQISVDEKYYGNNESLISTERNIDKPRSQFPKSPKRTRPSKSLPHRYRCPESPQDFVNKQPYSAKLSTLTSKRNILKLGKTLPKLQKSSEHTKTPPQKYFHRNCTCLFKSLQDHESKKTSERPREPFFSCKSKHNSIDIPNHCPCTSTQNYLNKISIISDVPVNWQTAKQSLFRSSGRTEKTSCVNEPFSRVPSSKIALYSSKISNLVLSFRSKLFSRKSNQTKISKNSTNKPPSVIVPSLQVKPKKVDRRDISINDNLESILDVESNPSHPLPLHSSHNSGPSVINKSPLRQCTKKNRYIRKPIIVDKSYACRHNKARPVQQPYFLSHTNKYECRSQSNKVDPRVSQSIISQQSKTSMHSSIVTLFTRKPRQKSQSVPKKSSQKFDPQYFSSLMNCQQTPTARQALLQELPPGPNTLKSKRSVLLKQLESKPLVKKIRSKSDKISANSHKKKQVNKSSTSTHKVKKQFDAIPQQPKVEQRIPIIPGKCRCVREQNFVKEHLSNPKQFEAIPQQLKAKKVKRIISGRCRCAGNQNNTVENFSNKKLQPNMDLHNFTVSPINNINSPPFRIVKLSEISQHLANQALKSPAAKLTQLHSCQQTSIPLSSSLYNSQPIFKKSYKCRSFKYGNELEVPNSSHKIAKKRISHQSTNKLKKSHLISHVCSCSATTKRLGEHTIVQKSDISQSSGIQANLKFQIYQQNLPDQKRIIQSPTNVDKPSRKSLQQHSDAPCAYPQKSTAESEVRQPYPDFNRVSMRYPALNKTSLKQSLQIPGINCPPPTNNYSPAPGDTPPPNYASDPCYTIPPRVLKSPSDESALRCAYKRRPLRYTPPRQQLPRVDKVKKLEENKQRCAEAKRRKKKQPLFQCLRQLVNKTEREVWPTDFKCHPMWLNALKIKPCFCVYKVCPRVYPAFLNCRKATGYIGKMFVYFLTLCFWSPFLFCAYLCCNVLCKCCA